MWHVEWNGFGSSGLALVGKRFAGMLSGVVLILSLIRPAWAEVREYTLTLEGKGSLKGITVNLVGTEWVFTSEESGVLVRIDGEGSRFRMETGPRTVEVIRDNRKSLVSVTFGTDPNVKIPLKETGGDRDAQARTLDTVEIAGGDKRKDMGRQVLTAREIRTMPGAGGDMLRALENMPGILRGAGGEQGLFVRGSGAADMAYRLGFMRIGDPFHPILFSQFSMFPGSVVDRIEFFPGGFPPGLGGVQGGVVQVFEKTEYESPGVHGVFDVNPVATHGNLTIPLGPNMRLTASGRRTYFEPYIDFLKLIPSVSTWISNGVTLLPVVGDYFVEFTATPDAHHRLTARLLGARDEYTFSSPGYATVGDNHETNRIAYDESQKIHWDGQSVDWHYERDGVVWDLLASHLYQWVWTANWKTENVNSTNHGFQAVARLGFPLGKSMRLETGLEYTQDEFDSRIKMPPPGSETNLRRENYTSETAWFYGFQYWVTNTPAGTIRPVRRMVSPWLQWEANWKPVTLAAGSRFSINPDLKSVEAEPRVEATVALSKGVTLFSRFGRYAQQEAPVGYDAFGFLREMPAVEKLPGTWQVSAGLEAKGEGSQLKLEGYYKRFEGQAIPNPTFDPAFSISAESNPTTVYSGSGRAMGLEFLFRKAFGKTLSTWFSYALAESTREVFPATNTTYVLTDTNRNGLDFQKIPLVTEYRPQDIIHMLRAMVSWQPSPRFQIGTRVTLKSGQPYTKRWVEWTDGSTTNSAANGVVNAGELRLVDDKTRFTERYPLALSVDLRMDWIIPIGKKGAEMRVYLDLWNLQGFFGGNNTSWSYDLTVLRDMTVSDWSKLKVSGDRVEVPAKMKTATDPFALTVPLLGVSFNF